MDLNLEGRVYKISRKFFFEEWLRHPKDKRNEEIFRLISLRNDLTGVTESSVREMKLTIAKYGSQILKKWDSCARNRDRFLAKKNNEEWLEGPDISFDIFVQPSVQPSTSTSVPAGPGRPHLDFHEASTKTKRRRIDDLLSNRSTEELVYAAEVSTRLSGQRNVARVIKEVTSSDPDKCSDILKKTESEEAMPRCLSNEEALAYYVDARCTSHAYKQTRKWSIRAGHKVFPSYYSVRKAKLACLPLEEQTVVNETRAEIKLQAVLDKTAQRLVAALHEVFNSLSCTSFTLISRWGCDGSSGHSTYKQKFTDGDAANTDEFLFVFSFVPLRLLDEKNNIVWQNPRPSSTVNCRPIKFIFAKETKELTVLETNNVLEEINNLLPTVCKFQENELSVTHELLSTMVDGKVCNAVTETKSTQTCYICNATPKLMNDEGREFTVDKSKLCFGLSTLHAWIRTFECLLHISYRLDVKQWRLNKNIKASVDQRSDEIKHQFKSRMGLIVDKPKPGYGNSNDGNTARRFFQNAELSAEITGLDAELIKKFDILLRALSSGYDINLEKFKNFALETKNLYLNLYSWYNMPVTVHKILLHSSEFIKTFHLPMGQLSEEAQEARNKDCRRFREHNTRKCSRIATNKDLLNMLLITSDPVINSLREVPRKKCSKLASEVLDLLNSPSVTVDKVVVSSYCKQSDNHDHDYSINDSSESDEDD